MRISAVLVIGSIEFFACTALLGNPLPAGVQMHQGVGPSGVVESTYDPQPRIPDFEESVPFPHRFEVPDATIQEIKKRPMPIGDNGARIIGPVSAWGKADQPVAAPALDVSFPGRSAANLAPPDPCMAVGPNHIVLSVNTVFSIYSKTGTQQFATGYSLFFSSVNNLPSLFDPKVVYDHYAGRWIVMILAVGTNASSYLIAASDDSDPNGIWYKYSSPAHLDGTLPTTNGADFPGIGFDNEAVYLTSNQFASFLDGGFLYSKIRIFKKSELYNNSAPPLTYTDFTRMTDSFDGGNTFTIKPAVSQSPLSGTFLVNTLGSSGTHLELWRITNPTTAPVLSHRTSIFIGNYSAPPDAVQPFGEPLVNTNNSTLQSEVHYRNGRLYFAFPQAHNFGGGTVAAVRYLEMDTTGSVKQNIIYGADGEYLFFPAPLPLPSGNVAMVFSHSSAASYPGARYVGNFPDDMTAGVLKNGDTTYFCDFCGARNRWGDYAGIWQDPAFPRRVWLYHEYAAKPQPNRWGTWVGAITLQNHAPILTGPENLSVNENETLLVDISASEPDGEALSSFDLVGSAPSYLAFTLLGEGQGRLSLTPGCFDVGADTITIVAADSSTPALADTLTVAITVLENNCAPLFSTGGTDTVFINQCQTLSFPVSAFDPDSSGAVSFSTAPAPAFASVSDLGGGNGSLQFSPTTADLGLYTVQVFASDGQDSGVLALPVQVFPKGDLNRDGTLTPADVVLLLLCTFVGSPPPAGMDACDLDGGGASPTDVVLLLGAAFAMSPLPPC